MIIITGNDLTIDDVIKVVRDKEQVKLSNESRKKIRISRDMVKEFIKNKEVVYGVTTGFGKFSEKKISPDEAIQLQENLIMSHSAGTGRPLPQEVVKAMMLLRVNALAKGYSGIRLEPVQLLIDMINNEIIPCVPYQGSVGASGDLVPLAHMVLVMSGMGEADVGGESLSGQEALNKKGLKPVELKSKEGLALINGTQMMSALGALAAYDSLNISRYSDMALSLSLEALKGILSAYDEDVQKAKPHPGQRQVASNIRQITRGSGLALYNQPDRVQDAYTLRCGPQVHGPSRDAISHVKEIINREINSATDNPLLFPEKNKVISGGNFHGQSLALGLDYLAMAVSELGNISERRIARLTDGSLNNGLPMFLTFHGGLNSGYMIPQYTAASLVAENKVLANPASTDSIPTSANQEDHVSMGSISARKLREIVNNVEQIIAIELILACQGIDLRTEEPGKSLGRGSRVIYQEVRKRVDILKEDRVLYHELKEIKGLVSSGELVQKLKEIVKDFN